MTFNTIHFNRAIDMYTQDDQEYCNGECLDCEKDCEHARKTDDYIEDLLDDTLGK